MKNFIKINRAHAAMKTKFLTLFCCLMVATTMFAYDATVGGLYYNLNSTNYTATVTYKSYSSGYYNTNWNIQTADIPSSITVSGKTYSVTSIGDYAFEGCSGLTSITIPNSVTSIGSDVFHGCSSLTSITIPNSVTSIGAYAFVYCSSLASVTIPNSVTSIGRCAFDACSSLTSVIIGNSVTSIGYGAFNGCRSLASVTIPNSVTSIEERVFESCTSLTSVTIGNSVTSIGKYAFKNCSSLTSVTIGNSVTSIEDWAFEGCTSLTSVTIGSGVTSIGGSAFYNCSSLTSITIGSGVTSIGNYAFSFCSSLTFVTIPNSVTSIEVGAFAGCSSLPFIKVEAANSAYCDIDGVLFSKDKKTLVQYPAGKTAASYTIPNSVTSIGDDAFCYCSSLTSITIPNNVTSIGNFAFAVCSSLTSITIPNSVASIGESAFAECSSLTSVTIGNSVTSIGEEAFAWCSSLKNVVLGSSVKVLEKEAFYGCEAIETITCYSMRPPTVKGEAFDDDLPYNTIIYVPADSYETYYNHDVWGLYDVRRIGAASTETNDVKVTPTETTADVVWPVVTGAASYELVIRDLNGNIICTLVFNANGQLTSITFNAPGRDNAPDNVQKAGFSFTVSGLKAGTTYNYTLTAKDSGGNTLDTRTGSFKTIGEGTAVEETEGMPAARTRKVMRDGVMYILMPDGRMYDLQGAEL